jgi:hypothetical protein
MFEDEEIGFGKPPKWSQFRKGRSGNPRGRPKGRKNLATIFYAACNEKVRVKDGHGYRTITKLEAMSAQLLNKAASGDISAAKEVIKICQSIGAMDPSALHEPSKIIVEFVDSIDGKPVPSVSNRLLDGPRYDEVNED